MSLILYCNEVSPPTRAVLLTAHALDLELDIKEIHLSAGENMTPEYLEMNPQHTIPTLEDEGFYLWDSHAIACYLVNKYAQDDFLYPKDPNKRAVVDQRLHFDSNILQPRMAAVFNGIIFDDEKTVPEDKLSKVLEAYAFLEAFLNDQDWLTGDSCTVADLSIIATISSINVQVPVDAEEFPRLVAWMERCESLPYYQDSNATGLQKLSDFLTMKLES